ncbi:MAG: rod shape-determining protein [Bdellovibrionota bacterium]
MFSWFKSSSLPTGADIYVDLGTANTLIAARGLGIILNEPSIVAFTEPSPGKRKIIGVGQAAKTIMAKTTGNVMTIKPVRDGVIADFDLAQEMLRYFLSSKQVKGAFSRPRVVVSLPYGVTEVEKRAVIDACHLAGAKQVLLIDEPMAAAIGAGLPVQSAKGCMIIDIGGGTTEVAVIALSDIVYCEAVRCGGHKIDQAIVDYFKKVKRFVISDNTAEELKIAIGTAVPKKEIRLALAQGRDADSGLPRSLEISSEDVGLAMNDALQEIINAIHRALEHTPPELVSDIIELGIVLAGGGALIRDFDLRIRNEVRLPVRIADNPLVAIAKGGELALEDQALLEKIQLPV